jgi:O-antigen/teichoic acid export membrane protein
MAIFVLIIVVTNFIFIPLYGMTGAGIANAISLFLFNLMRWIFLWNKYDFQPFNFRYLLIILFAFIAYIPGYYLPEMNSFIIDIIIRSGIIFIIFSLLIYFSKVSEDINNRVNTYISLVFKKN